MEVAEVAVEASGSLAVEVAEEEEEGIPVVAWGELTGPSRLCC